MRVGVTLAILLGAGCGGPSSGPSDMAYCTPAPIDCVAPTPSFVTDVEPAFERHCTPCHKPGGLEQNMPYTTYDGVYGQRQTILFQLVNCLMPPKDGGVEPPEGPDRALMLDWLVCGSPNN